MENRYGQYAHMHGEFGANHMFIGRMAYEAQSGRKIYNTDVYSGLDVENLKKFYEKFGAKIKYETRNSNDLEKKKLGRDVYWETTHSYGRTVLEEGAIATHFSSSDLTEFNELYQFFNSFPDVEREDEDVDDNRGQVYVLTVSLRGYEITELGYAAVPIEWDNYAEDVQIKMKAAIEDLSTDTPRGRMLILEGEPGTGKTFLMRGLVNNVANSPFVIVPASAVPKLGDPNFMNFMLRFKNENDFEGPLVLMLEDADKCLVKREDTDLSGISSILNLSDGILGEMMDIRIVATTNAATVDFDPAILRKGRLSQHVEVNKLSPEEGNAVFNRLVDGKAKGDFAQPLKLGEVYDAAYQAGWRPPNKKERAVMENKRIQEAIEKLRKPTLLQQYYGQTEADPEKVAEAEALEEADKRVRSALSERITSKTETLAPEAPRPAE